MPLNQNGINLIKSFEQLRLKAYDDKQPNKDISDPSSPLIGILTVGYGSTGSWVQRNTVITEDQAEHFLVADLAKAEAIVDRRITVPLKLIPHENFSHFFSSCYHIANHFCPISIFISDARLNIG